MRLSTLFAACLLALPLAATAAITEQSSSPRAGKAQAQDERSSRRDAAELAACKRDAVSGSRLSRSAACKAPKASKASKRPRAESDSPDRTSPG